MEKLKRLIIVAAPSCCGKSTFINQLTSGEIHHIEECLGIKELDHWDFKDIYLHEDEILNIKNPQQANLILHYTIPYPALKYIFRIGYDKRQRLKILQASHNITFLTLYANPDTLLHRIGLRRKRINERRLQGKVPIHKYMRSMRTLSRLERIYANPIQLISMYHRWLEQCKNFNLRTHFLVNVEHLPQLKTVSMWSDITDEWSNNDRRPDSRNVV